MAFDWAFQWQVTRFDIVLCCAIIIFDWNLVGRKERTRFDFGCFIVNSWWQVSQRTSEPIKIVYWISKPRQFDYLINLFSFSKFIFYLDILYLTCLIKSDPISMVGKRQHKKCDKNPEFVTLVNKRISPYLTSTFFNQLESHTKHIWYLWKPWNVTLHT